ncbi:fibronectin type III domain-containing protein [uncultured Lamprocystis sp.]|nr:fibronectin type III domain-containing protein [uncultured Lamprocystis sp.]
MVIEKHTINGPPTPPPGFGIERLAVYVPEPDDRAAGINILTVPAFNWVFGCSAVSGAMIAGYYDRADWPNIYTGPTAGGVMPLNNSVWPTWSDGTRSYPNCPLIASKAGMDGSATRGSIDDYWVTYASSNPDPYLTSGWQQHEWTGAIGDFMWTSQSAYGLTDGATQFYNYGTATRLTCAELSSGGYKDGTLGRKRFYEARGYAVTDCYNQKTDNTVAGGFSFAQYKAEIDAGRPVLLNLAGHSIVGVGYDDSTSVVYLHDTWDYSLHTMTWGTSYTGMALQSVSIVNLAASLPTPPANLSATGASPSRIDLTWTDHSITETGFPIERKTGPSGIWSPITTVGANVTSYSDTGLAAATTYVYRVRSTNAAGSSDYSSEAAAATLSNPATAPTVTTFAASVITANTARLNGTVNDNGAATSVSFEYGLTTGDAATVAAIPDTISAGEGNTAVTADLSGLACNTLYHFRVTAVNRIGTTNGDDLSFTTAACPAHTITATAEPSAGGTVSCDPNPVPHGGTSLCTAAANPGYTFSVWSGDCGGATCELTEVTVPRNVTAGFAVLNPDQDEDGVPDASDTCPLTANPTQTDADSDGLGDACDSVQSGCRADALTVNPMTFGPAVHTLASGHSITTRGVVAVQTGADATLQAPVQRFGPGFRVACGGRFQGRSGPVTCAVAGAPQRTASAAPAALHPAAPSMALVAAAHADGLPAWLQALLGARGGDLAVIDAALLDPQGQWLLFETTQTIHPADRNGAADIYRLDLLAETLTLISRTPQGRAGNGASRGATADTLGDWIVFQSDADDLTADDANGVTDIFLHEVALGATRRITASADQPSAHPALDAAGQDLLYDQSDAAGQRHILADSLWGGTPAEPISLAQDDAGAPLDNHHPAISADGRFVAYLETRIAAGAPECQVYFYDRDSRRYQRQPCPATLAAASEAARPFFNADGAWVEWHRPGADAPVIIANPLLEVPLGTSL